MASAHLSVRVDESTLERLDTEIMRIGRTRSDVAKTLIEEGLRIQAHPGIIFRSGPAGRRAGLIGGPDIWEIATISLDRVGVALRYYARYHDEIDAEVRRRDESSERRRAAWLREQALLAT